jgi:hypothetical protein
MVTPDWPTGFGLNMTRIETMKLHTQLTAGMLLAGLLAGGNSLADERSGGASSDKTREQAREAVETAAREAAQAVRASNQLDLDIRLIGPTSVTIASDR